MRLPRLSALLTPLGHSLPLQAQKGLGVGLCWRCEAAGTPSLLTHLFQTKPCRCPRGVAPIIERKDLGCASNLGRVLISLTAPHTALGRDAERPPKL